METSVASPLILFGGIGMILVALGFIFYAIVRRLGLSFLGFGMLMWVVTVLVKFAWAIPLNPRIHAAMVDAFPGSAGLGCSTFMSDC